MDSGDAAFRRLQLLGAGQIPSSMSSETCFVRKCREPPPTKQARGDGTAGRLELCRGSGATTRRRTGHTWADDDGAREGGGLARRHRYRSCWPCGCPGPVGSRVLPECSAQMFCPEAQPPGLQFQAQSPVSKPLAQPPVFKTSRPQGPAGLETDPGPAASAFGPAASQQAAGLRAAVAAAPTCPGRAGAAGRRGGAPILGALTPTSKRPPSLASLLRFFEPKCVNVASQENDDGAWGRRGQARWRGDDVGGVGTTTRMTTPRRCDKATMRRRRRGDATRRRTPRCLASALAVSLPRLRCSAPPSEVAAGPQVPSPIQPPNLAVQVPPYWMPSPPGCEASAARTGTFTHCPHCSHRPQVGFYWLPSLRRPPSRASLLPRSSLLTQGGWVRIAIAVRTTMRRRDDDDRGATARLLTSSGPRRPLKKQLQSTVRFSVPGRDGHLLTAPKRDGSLLGASELSARSRTASEPARAQFASTWEPLR